LSAPHRRSEGRFAQLIAPVPLAELLQNHLLREPLYVPSGGSSAKLVGLPGRKDIQKLLESAEEVRAVFAQLRQADIDAGDAEDMFLAGATICMTHVESASPAFEELIQSARRELQFSGSISLRAYWSPPGGGFAPHFDARVVTTLQVEGRKRWWFGDQPVEVLPIENRWLTDEQRAALEKQPVRSVTLNPGDVLCLPPGVVHWASAESESLSYNVALDYVEGTVADVLTSAVCEELLSEPAYRSPLFGSTTSPEPTLALLKRVCLAASEALLIASDRPDLLLDLWRRSVTSDEEAECE